MRQTIHRIMSHSYRTSWLLWAITASTLVGCEALVPHGAASAESVVTQKTAEKEKAEETPKKSNIHISADLAYRVLIAETLAMRGQVQDGAQVYLDAAQRYTQPALTQRGYELASQSGNRGLLEQATQLNIQQNPQFIESWQVQVILKLRDGNVSAAVEAWESFYLHSLENGATDKDIFLSTATLAHDAMPENVLLSFAKAIRDKHESPYADFMQIALTASIDNQAEQAMRLAMAAVQRYPDVLELPQLLASLVIKNPDPQALSWLSTYWQAHTDQVQVGEQLGRAYVVAQDLNAAKQQFEKVLSVHPKQLTVQMSLALVNLELQQPQDAVNLLQPMLNNKRFADMARYYLGQAYEAMRQTDQALAVWAEVQGSEYALDALIWRAQVLAKMQRWSEAETLLQNYQADDEAEILRVIKARSRLMLMQGKKKDALAVLDQGVLSLPENDDVWQERANLKFELGDTQGFEQDIRQAIRLNPDNADALNALGYYLADRKKNLAEARQLLEQANALSPNRHYITDSLGWLAYREGKLQLAESLLAKAYALKADSEVLMHWLTVLLGSGQQDKARELVKQEASRFPNDSDLNGFLKQKSLMP